jgi:hypothetical protein
VNGRLLTEIPGVRVQQLLTNQNYRLKPEPRFLVPRGLKYKIAIDGSTLKAADTESVSVIGPGYSAVVSDIVVRPDEKHALTVRGNGTRVAFRGDSNRTQSPDLELGFDRPGRDSSFAVATHKLKGDATVTASVKPSAGTLQLGGAKTQGANAVVGLTTVRRSGATSRKQQSVGIQGKPRCRFRKGGRACTRGG